MRVKFFACLVLVLCSCGCSFAGLLSEPAVPGESSNTVPAFPVQTEGQVCRLDLSDELFGGVSAACGRNLDRSRCCPVLAAWLFAAHARSALEVPAAAPPTSSDLPMMPDDSQKCVNSLQSSLQSRNIHIPQPNASCDAVLCFCGIRLHQITSLSCPAAFNLTGSRNATPTPAVKNLERNCRNSSYAGCTRCLGALQKVIQISSHLHTHSVLLHSTELIYYLLRSPAGLKTEPTKPEPATTTATVRRRCSGGTVS